VPVAAAGPPPPAFEAGLRAHQAGDLAAAAEHYREALEAAPNHPDSLHLLGVALMQQGDLSEAAERMERAIALRADLPAYHDHLGLCMRQMGKPAEAEPHHRRALEIDANFQPACNNLAGTLLALGRPADAESFARRSLELKPGDPDTSINLGQIFLAQGRARAAVDAFQAGHRAKPGTVDTWAQMGQACQRAGFPARAEEAFRRAADLDPERAAGWMHLGGYYLAVERFDDAAEAFHQAAACGPADIRALANRGVALWRGGALEEAEAVFLDVLDQEPDDVTALLGLAAICSAQGDADDARRLYRRVLEIDPDNLDVYNNLNNDGETGLSDEDALRLADLLGRTDIADDDRAKAGYALAGYLRRCGEHAAAFDVYATANEFRAAALSAAGVDFSPENNTAFVDSRIDVFTADFLAARRDFGSDDEAPVFVVGMPRSGTTLVEQILASHPKVFGAGERRDVAVMALQRLPGLIGGDAPYPECLRQVEADHCRSVAEEYLSALRPLAPRAARIVDKMPFNFLHLGLIALVFPKARIIHCRCDMRDVAVSCYFTNFADSHPWSTDLGHLARFINDYERLMSHWKTVLPAPVLEIDYETLVADLEGESRRMLEHVGLPWNAACLSFHETDRPVSTAARAQVRRPIYSDSVGRWRTYETWLGVLTDLLDGAAHEP